MTCWTFHGPDGFPVSDRMANEPDDADRIAQALADARGVEVVAVPNSERGETFRKVPFATWTDSDLRATCRIVDSDGDWTDASRAYMVETIARWHAEEPTFRMGGAS